MEYTQARDVRDSLTASLGWTSTPPAARAIRGFLAGPVGAASQNDNPEWALEYAQQDYAYYAKNAADLAHIVYGQEVRHRQAERLPWIGTAQAYLTIRQQINDELDARGNAGGSANIQAKSNADLAVIWESRKQQLADLDPSWAEIDSRFFANDDLGVVPGEGMAVSA